MKRAGFFAALMFFGTSLVGFLSPIEAANDTYSIKDVNTISAKGGVLNQACAGQANFVWGTITTLDSAGNPQTFTGYNLGCSTIPGMHVQCWMSGISFPTTATSVRAALTCSPQAGYPSGSVQISNPNKVQLTNGPPPGATSPSGSGVVGNPFEDHNPVCVALPIFPGPTGPPCPPGTTKVNNDPSKGGIIGAYLVWVLRLFNLAIGGIIVLVLVLSGIMYITSAADPGRVKSAKKRIEQAITALVLYMFMFAILNFIVPGGVL